MAKKSVTMKLEGKTYKLRLTMHGMREIHKQFSDEEPLSTLLSAVSDVDKLCLILDECLNWGDEADNPIKSGEEFYDLLVDCGHGGQEGISDLVFDLATYAGLVTADNAAKMRSSMHKAIKDAYNNLGSPVSTAADSTNPT